MASALSKILLMFFLSILPALAAEGQWEEVSNSADVTVYRKEIAGSPVMAYRGVAVIPFPVAKVLTAIKDTNHRAQWTDRMKHAEVVREISPTDRVEYLHVSAPFPVRDRDFVVRSTMSFQKDSNRVLVHLQSIDDPSRPPEHGRIRGVIHESQFTLAPIGASATKIEAEIHADPKGNIPKFLVNAFQKNVPQKSITRLKKYMSETPIADDPQAVAFFSGIPSKRAPAAR